MVARAQQTFYLIALGGTAMAPLAGLLIAKGERVEGSDLTLYPPMSDRIRALGIDVRPGFHAENLPQRVDRVVVGNLAGRDNPELVEALRRDLPLASMPETLHDEFLAGRHPVVITGTHGKTTTSALTAWLLASAGRDPGFLIGGEPLNFPAPCALGTGAAFVVEGDEYSTSYADLGPKFLHYAPRTLVITSIEFDHADLYADLDAIKAVFARAVALVPDDGCIVANGEDPHVRAVLTSARARVVLYRVEDGAAPDDTQVEDTNAWAGLSATNIVRDGDGTRFDLRQGGSLLTPVSTRLAGRHNIANALAAAGVGLAFGLTPPELAAGLATFRGVRRRLEERGVAGGVTVLDDFAHHPTAVATTVEGARRLYPGRRLWAVFEPRSITGGRAEFLDAYLKGLSRAHGAVLCTAYHASRLERPGGAGALDVERLARELNDSGVEAFAAAGADLIVSRLVPRLRSGDVVLTMSSGSFGGLPGKLLAALSATESGPSA
ncbi:MAG: Mur ligase family protein [Thermoanaerobaculia bacterium]